MRYFPARQHVAHGLQREPRLAERLGSFYEAPSQRTACLAQRVRECAMLEERLSPQQRALALLQAAWAVGFGRDHGDCEHCSGSGAGSHERK